MKGLSVPYCPALLRELQSMQEEADTKMFLCALIAHEKGFSGIKIVTVDTNVVYRSLSISLYVEIGSGSKAKMFDIKLNTLPSVSCAEWL